MSKLTASHLPGLVEHVLRFNTCQKRAIVCVLYDRYDNIVGIGTNKCTPDGGKCARLQTVQAKEGYTGTECHSLHAEIDALSNMLPYVTPVKAELYGHDFPCDPCEKALRSKGVTIINVMPCDYGTGLKEQNANQEIKEEEAAA